MAATNVHSSTSSLPHSDGGVKLGGNSVTKRLQSELMSLMVIIIHEIYSLAN
jgi:hypothetical protein